MAKGTIKIEKIEKDEPKELEVHELESDCWYKSITSNQIVYADIPGHFIVYDDGGGQWPYIAKPHELETDHFVRIHVDIDVRIKFKDVT